MDNNNPVVPPTPQAPAAGPAPVVPNPQVIPQPVPSSSGGTKKMIIMIVLAFVVVALLLGGVLLYMNSQKAAPKASPDMIENTQVLNNLSTDINNVEVATPGAEFSTVDSELDSL